MSFGSEIVGATLLALLLFACSVDAHAWMSNPAPRGQYITPKKYSWEEYQPATSDPNNEAIICRGDPVMPRANWVSLTAGREQTITLEFNAIHPGDCFVYLTYDGDKAQSQMKWFKIWEQHECYRKNSYNIPIPSYLPSGEHVIFRWEWYALHVYPTVEYYTSCVDAVITGSASGSLPQPQVNIPGHLPVPFGDFLSGNNNYWWPYDNQPMFFTGPRIATLNGQPNPTSSPSTPAPTPKPTNKPTNPPTKSPTTPPVSTTRPTIPPPSASTTRPTSPPTPKPPTPTVVPTKAPTTKPTSTPKPPTPTVVPTRPPSSSTSAPSNSVKLLINRSSSVWWFACSVSQRSSEVSKFEVKDSGVFTTFRTMTNEWADVYTFAPSGTALVLPLTIKVTLVSGSSLSFSVNSVSSSSVDSGTVFA